MTARRLPAGAPALDDERASGSGGDPTRSSQRGDIGVAQSQSQIDAGGRRQIGHTTSCVFAKSVGHGPHTAV